MGTVHDIANGQKICHNKGNEPPEPPKMEARIARLEAWAQHTDTTLSEMKSDIKDIKRDMREDFRILFGVIVAVALGLAGMMAKGFHWL